MLKSAPKPNFLTERYQRMPGGDSNHELTSEVAVVYCPKHPANVATGIACGRAWLASDRRLWALSLAVACGFASNRAPEGTRICRPRAVKASLSNGYSGAVPNGKLNGNASDFCPATIETNGSGSGWSGPDKNQALGSVTVARSHVFS